MTPKQFCEKYLKNYEIKSDISIDVDGAVYLKKQLGDMKKLPVKFGKVSGNFSCSFNNLTTLEGCPNYVGGYFLCNQNNLATLEGCPKYVGGDFYCYGNNLATLEGSPNFVCGDIVCGDIVCGDILTHHILGNIQGNISYNIKQRIVI